MGPGHTDIDVDESHFEATGVDARGLIQLAFGEPKDMIFGLPTWAEQARYDIWAKSTEADAETLKKALQWSDPRHAARSAGRAIRLEDSH